MKNINELRLFVLTILFVFSSCKENTSLDSNIKGEGYLFEPLSVEHSGIDFVNEIIEDQDHNIINYIYFYNGAGVAVGDINNDGLPDIYFVSNQGQNRLYLNQGDLKFKDITNEAGVGGKATWNTGVTMVDVDGDGFLDIYVSTVSGLLDFKGHNELFINNGNGTFTEKSKDFGLDFQGYSTQSYFFDYDKDDDLDVYIVNHAVHTTLSHGPAHTRNQRVPLVGDVLLKNDNGSFVDASNEANIFGGVNGYGLSAATSDFNNDGWDDIYVCNDFHEDDYFYLNNKDGTFSEALADKFTTTSRFSMGSDAADINSDGYQDLVTLDMLPSQEAEVKKTEGDDAMYNMQKKLRDLGYRDQYSRNMLQINNGDFFQEIALFNRIAATDWSWGPLIEDFNNDSSQDIFISNGILRRPNGLDFVRYVSSALRNAKSEEEVQEWLYNSRGEMLSGVVANEVFMGGDETFLSKTGSWIEDKPQISNGAVYCDLDLDGDLELVLNNFNDKAKIYRNTVDKTKGYLSLVLKYKEGNIEGIGSKVLVYHDGKRQSRQLYKSRGFQSSIEGKLHFGLGQSSVVDSIVIIWPDLKQSVLSNPETNTLLHFDYSKLKKSSYVNPINEKARDYIFNQNQSIKFVHEEDGYDDFFEHKLMPYRISNFGPAVAIGDVDKNGYEDLFLGNASGKMAKLFLSNGEGFVAKSIRSIELDSLYEDNDAVFIDVDNDKDLDLFVASGVSKVSFEGREKNRLYINRGGSFEKSNKGIPENNYLTSTVLAYDYDFDGDEDLFIGNLSRYHDYGGVVDSYLLKNDGAGNFSIDPNFQLKSRVNSATWQDVNDDGVKDLLVATEWDSPKIYFNLNGKMKLVDLPEHMNGLWKCIATFDIDKDGDKDVLLGNWGLNTKFNLNFDGPLVMYYSDFDSNGSTETILAYNRKGQYYPINSKMEMGSQINAVNKLYVYHSDYAGKSIERLLGKESIGLAEKFEVHTLASGFIENENGNFKRFRTFPKEFQYAPINSFIEIEKDNEKHLLVGGNIKGVNSYHGGYTSLKGILLYDQKDYSNSSNFGLKPINGQLKSFESIKMKDNTMLLVIMNNDSTMTYSY